MNNIKKKIMRTSSYITVLALYSNLLGVISQVSAYSKSSYSSVELPRPAERSDWHHEQFQKLHLASLESGAQTVFGYWCGPTIGGYCGSMSFDDINTKSVTHVPFAFASITADGTVSYEYDQGSVQQYNSSILINQGVMAGLSLGGSGIDANFCLNNIDNCVTTLGKTLGYYESVGSPFYFVDSDFEKPQDETQMQNLITFWLTFNEQFPGYLITMAPECAYLWCGAANWPYNSYVPVVNQLGPNGADIIYKINSQSYNNWCSNSPAGTAPFFEDVATTWIQACPSTGYLGLESNPSIFGLGVLAADKDGQGYAGPEVVLESLGSIGKTYGTYNGMFWDTLTDSGNAYQISNAMAVAVPEGSVAPTLSPTFEPTELTVAPTFSSTVEPTLLTTFAPTVVTTSQKPSVALTEQPTRKPTFAPSNPTQQPSSKPTGQQQEQAQGFADTFVGKVTIIVGGAAGVGLLGIFAYRKCVEKMERQEYQPLGNRL